MPVNINFELTGVGLIAIAFWALLFTRRQISTMQENNEKQAESARNQDLQLRASVLLSLDERWESETMTALRADLQSLIMDVLRNAAIEWPNRAQGELRRLGAPLFVAKLEEIETSDAARHLRLFRICGFFETVGYVVRAGYITMADVDGLLGPSIRTAAIVFRPYIGKLLSRGADKRLFDNFMWLVAELERGNAISLEA